MALGDRVAASIAKSVGCALWQVVAASTLLREGASVPFVARYRAHVTGGLEPAQLRSIEQAQREAAAVRKRREAIERALGARQPPVLTEALLERLRAAPSLRELEALYEPYRARRDTLAMRAHAVGVGALADALWRGALPSDAALAEGLRAAACPLPEAEQHLLHAVAELVSLHEPSRRAADDAFGRRGLVASAALPAATPADAATFAHYARYEMPLRRVRPHAWLALHRGAERGALKVGVRLEAGDAAAACASLQAAAPPLAALPPGSARARVLRAAVADAWSRLLQRSAASRAQRLAVERARSECVCVFASNLACLLRTPPVPLPAGAGGRAVLGVDPGLAHGHKCAVVDATTGALLATTTVPALARGGGSGVDGPPPAESVQALRGLLRRHAVCLVAVGDGTGSALAQRAVAAALSGLGGCAFAVVSEAGASAYSASALADSELGGTPVGERGAVSLARRVLDPLAELVKVPPSALGVGLYQKDVREGLLQQALAACVADAVAEVGVELNSASEALLAQVPGLGKSAAAAIRARIEAHGPLASRQELLSVRGLGPAAFQNCAGFLRLSQPAEPLDGTRVHPEAYGAARAELAAVGVDARALAAGEPMPARAAAQLRARAAARGEGEGAAEGRALAELLCDPLLAGDPRRLLGEPPALRSRALSMSDLRVGSVCAATVRNVTPFGAFCDLGTGTDALLHASELGSGGEGGLHVGARIRVRVLQVSEERRRISVALHTAECGLHTAEGGGGAAGAVQGARLAGAKRQRAEHGAEAGAAVGSRKRPIDLVG